MQISVDVALFRHFLVFQLCSYDSFLIYFKCLGHITEVVCLYSQVRHSQSFNEKLLTPWLLIKEDGEAQAAHCTCKAGLWYEKETNRGSILIHRLLFRVVVTTKHGAVHHCRSWLTCNHGTYRLSAHANKFVQRFSRNKYAPRTRHCCAWAKQNAYRT